MDNYDDNDFKDIGALVMILAVTPKLIKTVKEVIEEVGSFPTFPTKVVNMHVMWSTIAKCNGWEIQQNLRGTVVLLIQIILDKHGVHMRQ